MSDYCLNYKKIAYQRKAERVSRGLPAPEKSGAPAPQSSVVSQSSVVRLRCKQWSCDYCSRQNQRVWRGFLHSTLPNISSEWWLVTLTNSSWGREQYSSYKTLQKGIDILLKRVRRLFGDIEYVRTFEPHKKDGCLHAHFIMSGLSPYVVRGCNAKCVPTSLAVLERPFRSGVWSLNTWLKHNAEECGLGYMADTKRLEGPQAINYVTKYLTKELQMINIKSLRHVQTTRGIGAPEKSSGGAWNVTDFITARDFKPNDPILDLNTGFIVDNNYWELHGLYPIEDQ